MSLETLGKVVGIIGATMVGVGLVGWFIVRPQEPFVLMAALGAAIAVVGALFIPEPERE